MPGKNLIFIICALFLMSFKSVSYGPNKLIGSWKGENIPIKSVEFYLDNDGAYYGKLNEQDDENFGKIVFQKMIYDTQSGTFTGTLIPADKNISLNATISFENSDKIKVVTTKLMMKRIVYFSKIKPIDY